MFSNALKNDAIILFLVVPISQTSTEVFYLKVFNKSSHCHLNLKLEYEVYIHVQQLKRVP